jgi:hypothetical protein
LLIISPFGELVAAGPAESCPCCWIIIGLSIVNQIDP